MDKEIIVPKELLWDYQDAPNDMMWRLQRIVDFFPEYGPDRNTVTLLYQNKNRLNMERGKYKLIELYYEVWNEKTGLQPIE